MKEYTIIFTLFTVAQIIEPIDKESVRAECERLRKIASLVDVHTHARIEVVNNETGEIREYWNNSYNKINF